MISTDYRIIVGQLEEEAIAAAQADAKQNRPNWQRVCEGDSTYLRELILALCSMAHAQPRHPQAGETSYVGNAEHVIGFDGSLIAIE